mmetsp:Transcript_11497/g.27582  ORF Transcript_11497/g.27582 Transcript_11497/m.27582 type:complete len:346 (+) Transcript_11497:208-1245(+)
MVGLQYTDLVCSKLRQGRVFSDSDGHAVTSVDITPDGKQVVTASEDDGLRLYDSGETGSLKKTLFARKYGVNLVRFMHEPSTVVCASSNDWDFSLRYWSLHDNRYLRYLKGHRAKVVCVEVSPGEDRVVSASMDGTARLWDVRTDACAGLIKLKPSHGPAVQPNINFDDKGMVFAINTDASSINLYDSRNYDRGPFETFRFEPDQIAACTALKFSSDGKYILVSGGECVWLVDSFSGAMVRGYRPSNPAYGAVLHASITPDTRHVIGGTAGGSLHFWRSLDLPPHLQNTIAPGQEGEAAPGYVVREEVAVKHDRHVGPVNAVMCSKSTMLLVTACKNASFWIPDL